MPIEDLKQQIKDFPISRIIGHYLPLTRRGTQTLALCPFHQDSKPSLNVNDSKGMFMCFACNTGGDHITFVEKFKNINFLESLKEICQIMGIDFSDFQQEKQSNPEIKMARKILTKAVQIYQKVGEQNPTFHEFIKTRNLTKNSVDDFKLGHAPGNNIISNYLLSIKDKKERELAIKVGLKLKIIHPDKKFQDKYFDTFRDRIMFPIFDAQNNPMGFTSRATKANQVPKYLNSSESLTFIKKKLLYGVHLAKSEIRNKDQIILCEGNMDVISLHQKGFKNAVAIMGTAYNASLTPIIKSLSKNVILALDSDQAGLEASRRVNQFFLKEGIIPKGISFSPDKDPDEFLNNHGPLELIKRIENSIPFIDIELEKIKQNKNFSTIDQKIEAIQNAFELLSPLGKSIHSKERIAYFSASIGLKTNVDELFDEFYSEDHQSPKLNTKSIYLQKTLSQQSLSNGNYEEKSQKISKTTLLAIREILKNPEIMELENWGEMLDLLCPNEVKMWFASVQKLYFEVDDQDFNSMVLDVLNKEQIPSEFKSIVGATIYQTEERTTLDQKGKNQLLSDLIKRLKKDQLIERRKTLWDQHSKASIDHQEEILRQINNIQIEINNMN